MLTLKKKYFYLVTSYLFLAVCNYIYTFLVILFPCLFYFLILQPEPTAVLFCVCVRVRGVLQGSLSSLQVFFGNTNTFSTVS